MLVREREENIDRLRNGSQWLAGQVPAFLRYSHRVVKPAGCVHSDSTQRNQHIVINSPCTLEEGTVLSAIEDTNI